MTLAEMLRALTIEPSSRVVEINASFEPTDDDYTAADLAFRIGITVWIQRTSHGLLWAMQPMPLQRH